MKIKISNLSSMPIYQQIASEIRNKILSNELMSNTQLPSIRALSKELEVGIITIKKAYEVLLQENLIYSKGAVGYFVNEINREEILLIKKGEYLKEIEKVFDDLKSFVRAKGMRNCKFLFKDDPNQKEKFNIKIKFNVCANVKSDSLKTDSIKDFILNVASMKSQTLEYEKEVSHE